MNKTTASRQETSTSPPRGVLISAKNVSFRYSGSERWVLRECSLEIGKGEFMALIGASGVGKTTLSRCLGGRLRPTEGQVAFNDGRPLRDNTAVLPQNAWTSMNPRMRLFDIVTEPLAIRSAPRDLRTARCSALCEQVGLDPELLERYPWQVSGGQARRAAIARALAADPALLILDEPLPGLDLPAQLRILELARDLSSKTGVALVIVSHDVPAVSRFADRVAVLADGALSQ